MPLRPLDKQMQGGLDGLSYTLNPSARPAVCCMELSPRGTRWCNASWSPLRPKNLMQELSDAAHAVPAACVYARKNVLQKGLLRRALES